MPFLTHTQEEQAQHPGLPRSARVIFEVGDNKEGYFTGERFLQQIMHACSIAGVLYPHIEEHVFVFDHSSVHAAYDAKALVASRMNKSDGGAQPFMRDTSFWDFELEREVPQSMTTADGKQKGLQSVLQERHLWRNGMTRAECIEVLARCPDFAAEKPKVSHVMDELSTAECKFTCVFLPKFHCELNPIEFCWYMAKDWMRKQVDGRTMKDLIRKWGEGLDLIDPVKIGRCFRKTLDWARAYRNENTLASAEIAVKQFKVQRQSHRKGPTTSEVMADIL